MATATPTETTKITREALIDKLNEDLAREYQAIIAYVVYSPVLKGAEYMAIAKELEVHAGEELRHALTIFVRSSTSKGFRMVPATRSGS